MTYNLKCVLFSPIFPKVRNKERFLYWCLDSRFRMWGPDLCSVTFVEVGDSYDMTCEQLVRLDSFVHFQYFRVLLQKLLFALASSNVVVSAFLHRSSKYYKALQFRFSWHWVVSKTRATSHVLALKTPLPALCFCCCLISPFYLTALILRYIV